jgi:hypothetical protein
MPGGQVALRTTLNSLDPEFRDFTPANRIDWRISLPTTEVPLPIPISAVFHAIPLDENSGFPAIVQVDSSAVTIVVRELYPRLVASSFAGYSGSAVKGGQLNYLTFDLQNTNIGGDFPIGIAGFTFTFANNPASDASDLLSSAAISSDSGLYSDVAYNSNNVIITLPDTIYLQPSGRTSFVLMLGIKSNTGVTDFTLRLANNFVDAVVIENNTAAERLYAVTSQGEPVNWESQPTAILEQNFAASISCYPNPFNPRIAVARIGYFLPQSAELEIRIFTLFGELVWTKIVASSDPYGAAGLHSGTTALVWDGKNDIGNEIRSGVYICMIKNLTTGEEEKFKIAVVK